GVEFRMHGPGEFAGPYSGVAHHGLENVLQFTDVLVLGHLLPLRSSAGFGPRTLTDAPVTPPSAMSRPQPSRSVNQLVSAASTRAACGVRGAGSMPGSAAMA